MKSFFVGGSSIIIFAGFIQYSIISDGVMDISRFFAFSGLWSLAFGAIATTTVPAYGD